MTDSLERNNPLCTARPAARTTSIAKPKLISRLLLLFSAAFAFGIGTADAGTSGAIAQPYSILPFTFVAAYDDEDDEEDFEDESDDLPSPPVPLTRRPPLRQAEPPPAAYSSKPAATARLSHHSHTRAHARHGASRRHVGYRSASHQGHTRRNTAHHKPRYKPSYRRHHAVHRSSGRHVGTGGNRAKHPRNRHHAAHANIGRADHRHWHRQPGVQPRSKGHARWSASRSRRSEYRSATHRGNRSATQARPRGTRPGHAHGRRHVARVPRHGFARHGTTVHHAKQPKRARHTTTRRQSHATGRRTGRAHHARQNPARRVHHSRRHN